MGLTLLGFVLYFPNQNTANVYGITLNQKTIIIDSVSLDESTHLLVDLIVSNERRLYYKGYQLGYKTRANPATKRIRTLLGFFLYLIFLVFIEVKDYFTSLIVSFVFFLVVCT